MAVPDTYGPIDAVTKQAYSDNVALQVQLKTNKFEGAFTPIMGLAGREMQPVELVGASEAQLDYPTGVPQERIAAKHEGVYVYPRRITWPRTIPANYKIEALRDYQGPYTQEGSAAIARARAKIISNAILGPRYIRNDNTGLPNVVPYDWTNRIVAANYQYGGGGASSNMTLKKFIKGMELLGITNLDVDAEDIFCALTWTQNTALYQDLQLTNSLNTGRYQLEDKYVRSIMGVQIIMFGTTGNAPLGKDPTGTYRACPMWSKSKVHFGDAQPLTVNVERNPSLQYQIDIFMENWVGATRSEDEGVVAILCDETVG
jgi:hypothetical protein